MSQKFALYTDLNVRENLEFYGGVYSIQDKKRLDEVLELVGLREQQQSLVSELSAGWRQRLALGTAIIHKPKLLFLDEPTSGVDPTARRAFWDLIYDLVGQGVTSLVTTHYMDEAEYCGRVGIMREGRLLAMDTPSSLKTNSLPGRAWNVFAEPLLPALSALEKCPQVLRAGLVSDHLRAITPKGTRKNAIGDFLIEAGISQVNIEGVEPSLEDVFLALATGNHDTA